MIYSYSDLLTTWQICFANTVHVYCASGVSKRIDVGRLFLKCPYYPGMYTCYSNKQRDYRKQINISKCIKFPN